MVEVVEDNNLVQVDSLVAWVEAEDLFIFTPALDSEGEMLESKAAIVDEANSSPGEGEEGCIGGSGLEGAEKVSTTSRFGDSEVMLGAIVVNED